MKMIASILASSCPEVFTDSAEFVHLLCVFQYLAQIVHIGHVDGGDRLKIRILPICSSDETKVFKR